jgi:hypothetical protein
VVIPAEVMAARSKLRDAAASPLWPAEATEIVDAGEKVLELAE